MAASRTTPKSTANATTSAAPTRRVHPISGQIRFAARFQSAPNPSRSPTVPVATSTTMTPWRNAPATTDSATGTSMRSRKPPTAPESRRVGVGGRRALEAGQRQREEGHHDGRRRDRRDELHHEPAAEGRGGIASERAERRPEEGAEAHRAKRQEAGLRRRRPAARAGRRVGAGRPVRRLPGRAGRRIRGGGGRLPEAAVRTRGRAAARAAAAAGHAPVGAVPAPACRSGPEPVRRAPASRDRTPACAPSGGVSPCSHISRTARHPSPVRRERPIEAADGAQRASGRLTATNDYSGSTAIGPPRGPRRKPNG